jgi:hypothetical protein
MKIIITLFLSLFLSSCSSWKKIMVTKGNQNDAVQNAIYDFLHFGKLTKKDSVFSIIIKNVNEDILGVSILREGNKISVITENEIEYNYRAFPTRYFEQNGKLFYWVDSTEKVSIELVDILSKMNRIDTVVTNKFFPIRSTDDSQKATDYYFCKANLLKYKKVITNIAMGWYNLPKINCNP